MVIFAGLEYTKERKQESIMVRVLDGTCEQEGKDNYGFSHDKWILPSSRMCGTSDNHFLVTCWEQTESDSETLTKIDTEAFN